MIATTIAVLLGDARQRLAGVSETPGLDAEVLLAHALGKPRSHLHAWPERVPPGDQARCFAQLLGRRLCGEPVAYIVGRREFWSLELAVSAATLIPRPDTELLVELSLERIDPQRPSRIADLGTGSGALALALARERPQASVVATDCSAAALAVAAANARRLGIRNVQFRLGDWCAGLGGGWFELIACNPPYLAADDPHLRCGDPRFEPRSALIAGPDGLDAIRAVVAQAGDSLTPGGWLLLEHGCDQGEQVAGLLHEHGYTSIEDHRDGAGLSRVGSARRRAD